MFLPLTFDPQAFEQGQIFFGSEGPDLKVLFLSFAIQPLIDFSSHTLFWLWYPVIRSEHNKYKNSIGNVSFMWYRPYVTVEPTDLGLCFSVKLPISSWQILIILYQTR